MSAQAYTDHHDEFDAAGDTGSRQGSLTTESRRGRDDHGERDSSETRPYDRSRSRSPVHRGYQRSPSRSRSPDRREYRHSRSRSPASRHEGIPSPYEHRRSERDHSAAADNPGNNLFVSGLSSRVEEPELEDLFSKYGKVVKCQVMRDPHTKEHRGFAFVTMETVEDAERCKSSLAGYRLNGRAITVDTAKRARPRTPTPGHYQGGPKIGRQYLAFDVPRSHGRDRGYDRGGYGSSRDYDRRDRYDRRGGDYDRRDYDRRDRGYDRRDRGYDRHDHYDRYDRRDDYDRRGNGSNGDYERRRDDYDRRDRYDRR